MLYIPMRTRVATHGVRSSPGKLHTHIYIYICDERDERKVTIIFSMTNDLLIELIY